ncbi:MAG: zinc ABC transporter substrate-binding protein, partial [Gemmatimonadetes bacterium]|nr:zinc ABC transporter substrate-binding protein [Gemmatimonadota bacterium]
KGELAVLGKKGILVTSHDAFGYFGRAYGLEVHAVQGISTDSEAGLKEINKLVDLIVTRRVPTIFTESSVSPKNMQALREGAASRGWTVKFGKSLYSDAMGGPGSGADTYPGMVRANAQSILEGLR